MPLGPAGASGLEYQAIILRAVVPAFMAGGFICIAFAILSKNFDAGQRIATSTPVKHPLDD